MGVDSAAGVTDAVERFLRHYYQRRPVNATFTGVHDYDDCLPDWSPRGLQTLRDEMRTLRAELATPIVTALHGEAVRESFTNRAAAPESLDRDLAVAYLETQLAELDSRHGITANPSLWTGEAVFAVLALMMRECGPIDVRRAAAAARLEATPDFLAAARATFEGRPVPAAWSAKAQRDSVGAIALLDDGIPNWIASRPGAAVPAERLTRAAVAARAAWAAFATWLRDCPAAKDDTLACDAGLFDVLLERGHRVETSRALLAREAVVEFADARALLVERCREAGGSWDKISATLAADHPGPSDYLAAFQRTWDACRTHAEQADLVSWPDWPVRYVTHPSWTAAAAPSLYYLYYRSPAPFDPYTTHDYSVPALPAANPATQLNAWNHSVIKLNHVVHHGAIGHHVQNWHAYHRAPSRLARIGAVDCANRIGMFAAGTMAEGWACYATDLMEESGFFTPAERAAQQHARVRQLARAIVDIGLHTGGMGVGDAVRLFVEQGGMAPAAAQAEVAKCSMYPATAIMYWLGTREIHAWRHESQQRYGAAFSLRRFHDQLLGHGSIPVALARRLADATVPE